MERCYRNHIRTAENTRIERYRSSSGAWRTYPRCLTCKEENRDRARAAQEHHDPRPSDRRTKVIADLTDSPGWQNRALCKDVPDKDIFFPPRGRSGAKAKRVCAQCPVKEECLRYAVNNCELHGIWGGTSERERRTIRHRWSDLGQVR